MAVVSVEGGSGQARSWQCNGVSRVGGKVEGEGAERERERGGGVRVNVGDHEMAREQCGGVRGSEMVDARHEVGAVTDLPHTFYGFAILFMGGESGYSSTLLAVS